MTPPMIDDTNKYCAKKIPFPHQTGHMHAQPCTLSEHKHHRIQHILRYLERGNKKCTQQPLFMQYLYNAAKYTHTIHLSRSMQRSTQFICTEICIF